MRIATLASGIVFILLGILSIVFYEQYWSPQHKAETMLREAVLIAERKTPQATNESLKILTSLYAQYRELDIANRALLHISMAYENMGLNESALEKYQYLQNNPRGLSENERNLISKRIAHIQILRNYSDEAVSQLYQLLSKSTDLKFRSQVYTELGMLYYKSGEFKKSLNSFEIAEKEYGHNRNASLGKAKVLKKMGRHDEAFQVYQRFLGHNFSQSDQFKDVIYSFRTDAFSLGRESFNQKHYWQAIKYFRMVLEKFPHSREAARSEFYLGESYFKLGRFYPAIRFFKRIAGREKDSKIDDALFRLGESYFELKKFEIAAKYFNDILVKFPGSNYASMAKDWKDQCENEIIRRMKSSMNNSLDQQNPGHQKADGNEAVDADANGSNGVDDLNNNGHGFKSDKGNLSGKKSYGASNRQEDKSQKSKHLTEL